MATTVGFIGLGLMGAPMAKRLAQEGYSLSVFNRSASKTESLASLGARVCSSPADVARQSDIVITMLSNDAALREVAAGATGVLEGLKQEGIHIDCSTVSPKIISELHMKYSAAKRHFVHCPVLGSVPQASEGTLLLFAGTDNDKVFERIESVLKILGKRIWRFPSPEKATYTKILCNSFISGTLVMLAQGLIFAERSGVGGKTLLEILEQSALNSPTIQFKGKTILERNFTPRFYVENLLKDTNLMLDAAENLGVPAPVAKIAQELLEQATKAGYAREDYSAATKVWEETARK